MGKFVVIWLIFLFFPSNSVQGFAGDYFQPVVPIIAGDVFVWDIVEMRLPGGDSIIFDDTKFTDFDLHITVKQDLAGVDYLNVLLDPENYFETTYVLDNGTVKTGFIDFSTSQIKPTLRIHQNGSQFNIFEETIIVQGITEQAFDDDNNEISIERRIINDQFIFYAQAHDPENQELIYFHEERWDVNNGIQYYFEIKNMRTLSHTLIIFKNYDLNSIVETTDLSSSKSTKNSADTNKYWLIAIFLIPIIKKRKRINFHKL